VKSLVRVSVFGDAVQLLHGTAFVIQSDKLGKRDDVKKVRRGDSSRFHALETRALSIGSEKVLDSL
jgi:hypothetical protein